VAIQDVRGRHASQGDFYPFRHEGNDGIDMTRWLIKQSWCNGKIGAFGGSYLGFTQWAMATGNPGISSSNFPRYDPNPNTGADITVERNPVKASQQVRHSLQYPSALILPVMKGD
jgi:predicted acyl esterase